MSPRHGARLAALVAPLALLLPVAAHADQVVVDDAAADARALNLGSEFLGGATTEGPMFLDAPAETSSDIVRTTVAHGTKRVTLTLRFRDLAESTEHALDVRIFTPDGRYSLLAGMSEGSSMAQLYPERLRRDEGPRPCRAVRGSHDVAADVVTVSFPTACIDDPRWIQVSALVSRFAVTPQGDGSVNIAGWADDAFRSTLSVESSGRSPRVHRG